MYALGLLARREYSLAELRQRLALRGYADCAGEVVSQLAEQGMVSDLRYGESRVRVRAEQGVGPLRIQMELKTKGVAEDLIHDLLRMHDDAWLERACAARRKRFGAALPDERSERARQARFLQGRGFSFEQIDHAVYSTNPVKNRDL
ncbi:MAG: regulatory protein RecX [Gammaproteobacteria bacterium]|nr:regulatory protein RecX [Gammaproteobacteria bacterium]